MIEKCPYCFEEVKERTQKCPHCDQYFLDDIVEVDYHGAEKKRCLFCGKMIFHEAKVCKFCKRWLDEVDRAADDISKLEDGNEGEIKF
ncbi:MAG: hypothetical protein A2Z88_07350 [Omnitrophica WOR_2 bacterium GWA2_47_8]|nr:MAG: hypothetical protein A2Z88_07350 [Omnitrophica WOR_2 bacterium GWA2_47_8]